MKTLKLHYQKHEMLDSFYQSLEEKLLFELSQYEWVTGLAFKDFVTGHQIEINQLMLLQ